MRTIPRRWMLTGWVLGLPIFYAGLPFALSLFSRRHNWQAGRPGLLNDLGLVAVAGGLALIAWVLSLHYKSVPPEGPRIGNPFDGPGYVLTKGPYGFCRHPMHVGGLAVWFGWALFYGSVGVVIGATILLVTFVA